MTDKLDCFELVGRKLRLLRKRNDRQVQTLLHDTYSDLAGWIQLNCASQNFKTSLVKKAVSDYKKLGNQVARECRQWPTSAWSECTAILEVALGNSPWEIAELESLLDRHVWPIQAPPFFANLLSPLRFQESVLRRVKVYGTSLDDVSHLFAKLIASEHVLIQVHLRQIGRDTREALSIEVSKYCLYNSQRKSSIPITKQSAPPQSLKQVLRKQSTETRNKKLERAYAKLEKLHPNKPATWYAVQLAKDPAFPNLKWESIRKIVRQKRSGIKK